MTPAAPLIIKESENQFADHFMYYTPELDPTDLELLDAAEEKRISAAAAPFTAVAAPSQPTTYINWQYQQEDTIYIDLGIMKQNNPIIFKLRTILFGWLRCVCARANKTGTLDFYKHPMMPCSTHDVYFRAIQIADQYTTLRNPTSSTYQCVGIAALRLASKFEDIYYLDIETAEYVTNGAATAKQIAQCELDILCAVNNIAQPTLYTFYLETPSHAPKDNLYLLGLLYVASYIPCFCGWRPSDVVRICARYIANTPKEQNRIDISHLYKTCQTNYNHKQIDIYYDIICDGGAAAGKSACDSD